MIHSTNRLAYNGPIDKLLIIAGSCFLHAMLLVQDISNLQGNRLMLRCRIAFYAASALEKNGFFGWPLALATNLDFSLRFVNNKTLLINQFSHYQKFRAISGIARIGMVYSEGIQTPRLGRTDSIDFPNIWRSKGMSGKYLIDLVQAGPIIDNGKQSLFFLGNGFERVEALKKDQKTFHHEHIVRINDGKISHFGFSTDCFRKANVCKVSFN